MLKTYLIISWAHIDHLDDRYGRLVEQVHGTYEEARLRALEWINAGNGENKPVGIVEAIS